MKSIFTTIGLLFFSISYSQVGINTTSPNATLDVVSQPQNLSITDGIIPPKLTGEVLKSKDNLYQTDQTGAIVYITEPVITSSPKTINVTAVGYYYFDGSVWQKLNDTSSGGGNTNNIYTANGTIIADRTVDMNDKTLSFNSNVTSGTSHFNIDQSTFSVDAVNNRVGIGTNTPTNKLDIDGDLRIRSVSESTSTDDINIVLDSQGILKKQLSDGRGVFRGYLSSN